MAPLTPSVIAIEETRRTHARDGAPRTRRSAELAQRRVDALVAFVSFSLMLTILGLVFFALETWHA